MVIPAAAATRAGEPSPRLGLAVVTVAWGAVLARALILSGPDLRLAYVAGMTPFLAMLLVVIVRRPRATPALHVVFAAQAAIVLVLLALDTDHDFLTTLLVLESPGSRCSSRPSAARWCSRWDRFTAWRSR